MELGSVIAELPDNFGSNILRHSQTLFKHEDLAGPLPLPHVTVKYGLLSDNIEEIAHAIGVFSPVGVALGKMNLFMADSFRDTDVVKLDVLVDDDFLELRNKIEEKLEHQENYKDFLPHLSLGYVKPRHGIYYVKEHPLTGAEFRIGSVVIKTLSGERARLYSCGELYKYKYK